MTTETQPQTDPSEAAFRLILTCLDFEPPHQRGIVFSSIKAHKAIVAAGGQARQQLFGTPQGLLIRETAMIKLGDWTLTAAYERPAEKEETRAEFDRILAGMDKPAEPAPEADPQQPEVSP
jgi:hypothetical protein